MLHFWLRQLGFSFCDIYCWRLRDGCYLYLLVGGTAWSVEMLGSWIRFVHWGSLNRPGLIFVVLGFWDEFTWISTTVYLPSDLWKFAFLRRGC
jgi:hypothetical protein